MNRPKTVKTVLKRARAFLATHKWGKGDTYDPATGAFCATGALNAVAIGPRKFMHVERDLAYRDMTEEDLAQEQLALDAEVKLREFTPVVVYNSYGLRVEEHQHVTIFNDKPETTKEDVLALFDKAIEAAA